MVLLRVERLWTTEAAGSVTWVAKDGMEYVGLSSSLAISVTRWAWSSLNPRLEFNPGLKRKAAETRVSGRCEAILGWGGEFVTVSCLYILSYITASLECRRCNPHPKHDLPLNNHQRLALQPTSQSHLGEIDLPLEPGFLDHTMPASYPP